MRGMTNKERDARKERKEKSWAPLKKIIPAAKARKGRERKGMVGQKDKRDVPVLFSAPAPANVCASLRAST
jgi:hypothetical protein